MEHLPAHGAMKVRQPHFHLKIYRLAIRLTPAELKLADFREFRSSPPWLLLRCDLDDAQEIEKIHGVYGTNV